MKTKKKGVVKLELKKITIVKLNYLDMTKIKGGNTGDDDPPPTPKSRFVCHPF
jgi:hypothetical protein